MEKPKMVNIHNSIHIWFTKMVNIYDAKEFEKLYPSKHFLFSKTSWGHLEDVFSVKIFRLPRRLQEVFKTCLQDLFQRSLQDVFARRLQDVFNTSSRRYPIRLQDFFETSSRRISKTPSSRRLQDVLKDKKMLRWKRLQYVFKTSSVRLHQDEFLLGLLLKLFNNTVKMLFFLISPLKNCCFYLLFLASIYSFFLIIFMRLIVFFIVCPFDSCSL